MTDRNAQRDEEASLREVVSEEEIRQKLLQVLQERGPEKTACPSAVARAVVGEYASGKGAAEKDIGDSGPDGPEAWRGLMPAVRKAAGKLAAEGRIEVTQGGEPIDIGEADGPVRLRLLGGQ